MCVRSRGLGHGQDDPAHGIDLFYLIEVITSTIVLLKKVCSIIIADLTPSLDNRDYLSYNKMKINKHELLK